MSYSHGMFGAKIYKVWATMKARCYNAKQVSFKNYGGRGISVCNEWLNFEPFRDWSFDNGYKEGLTLDRVDVNKNYEPSNCRWVTWETQQNNRRNNRLITVDNITKTLSEWSEIIGINTGTIRRRIDILGWDTERAINTPIDIKKRNRRSKYAC